jgi:hypothetical protein
LEVDLLTMTGNVAQVFTSDAAWAVALRCCQASIRKGGTLVFETRTPSRQAWRSWTRKQTAKTVVVPELGRVDALCEVTEVALPLISFRWTYKFASLGLTAAARRRNVVALRDASWFVDAVLSAALARRLALFGRSPLDRASHRAGRRDLQGPGALGDTPARRVFGASFVYETAPGLGSRGSTGC